MPHSSYLLLASAAHTPQFFTEVAALLVAGALTAYVGMRVGLMPIVGFLLAGILIGPNAFGLVQDRNLVDAAAEVGVVLLLFTIGIEFSLEKLGRIRKLIFVGGGLQVGLTCLAALGICLALGIDWPTGLYTGFLLALSSTAIVLKLLASRGETASVTGQTALGLLIFQDLAVVAMVLLVPMLGGAGGTAVDVLLALGKAGLLIVLVLLFARKLLPPVLEAVARACSPELFLLTVIAICFGTAYLTSLAGVSLSLGAFLAGLIVSESDFSEHALGEILPLQILFSATFFVSVGMLLDIGFLVSHLPLVLGGMLAVLVLKTVTTLCGVAALGTKLPVAASTALLLAQVGEFSFVLEHAGRAVGLSPAGLGEAGSQTFIAVTVLLMAVTPALALGGSKLASALERLRSSGVARRQADEPLEEEGFESSLNHVVVAGYGQAARSLVRALGSARVPFVIITLSPPGARDAEDEGLPVLRGDATRLRTLQLAGAERAKMLVVADDDPATTERIAAVARSVNPTLRIVVRTRYESEVDELTKVGTDRVITEEMESIVQLFGEVLRSYEVPPAEVELRTEGIRSGDYEALRNAARAAGMEACTLDGDCLARRTFTLRAATPAVGKSLEALGLEKRFALVVDSLSRRGKSLDLGPDTVLASGDEISLRGDARGFASALHLFRTEKESSREERTRERKERALVDTESVYRWSPAAPESACEHVASVREVYPSARGCEECLQSGSAWVHLRICLSCGHVGCCDSSPGRHASAHHAATGHPIASSLEPGETWGWCYVDEVEL